MWLEVHFTLSCIHLYCACTTVPAPSIDPSGLPWHKSIAGRKTGKSKEEEEGDKGIIMASARARNTHFWTDEETEFMLSHVFTVLCGCSLFASLCLSVWYVTQWGSRIKVQ